MLPASLLLKKGKRDGDSQWNCATKGPDGGGAVINGGGKGFFPNDGRAGGVSEKWAPKEKDLNSPALLSRIPA